MKDKIFFDSDVLIDAHNQKLTKRTSASRRCVREAWNERSGVVSTTVLKEFYVGLLKQTSLTSTPAEARVCFEDYLSWHIVVDDVTTLVEAVRLNEIENLKTEFGLMFQSALAGGASTIYSYRLPFDTSFPSLSVVRPS